jgi:threonine/homoserine/homoserine lactone efflux protein
MKLLLAMFLFSLAMSITPGPVNIIILSSSINHGIKKTFHFVTGATIGFVALLLVVGFLFFQLVNYFPNIIDCLEILGSLYIAYLGYKIAVSKNDLTITKPQPPKYYEGIILQWANPKAWIACMSGTTIFYQHNNSQTFLIFTIIYFIVCYACLTSWAIFGKGVSLLLNKALYLRIFNFIMGFSLILIAVYACYSKL